MKKTMICPYCLSQNTITRNKEKGLQYYVCTEHPEPRIPVEYAENITIPREFVSAVGFRGHGKTIYFASLFLMLEELAHVWPDFYPFAVDEKSLDTVEENTNMLKKGNLPMPTPANFPIPTIVRLSNIPGIGNRFFVFYDTGGESFEKSSRMVNYASFVKRSKTVLFFINLKDIEYDGSKMGKLLSIYVQGLRELGGIPKDQHLLIVFSLGDELKQILWREIWNYLEYGGIDKLKNITMSSYINEMKNISDVLNEFTREELRAYRFLSFGKDEFKSMEFCILSSLGAAPVENRLQVEVNSKRVLDPILWIIYNSFGWFKRLYM